MTTMSTFLSAAAATRPARSSAFTGRFSATSAVPGLPGAQYSLSQLSLCASFHARACSLPPPPTSMILMAVPFLEASADILSGWRF